MSRHPSILICMLILLFVGLCPHCEAGTEWKPVDPSLLSKTSSSIDKDADVEGIFWEIWVRDSGNGGYPETEARHYLRLKVFNERGKEYVKQVDIPYLDGVKVKDIEARTIKPDGSVVELAQNSIFEKTLASVRGRKLKSKSFAFPAVEPGVIVEYQWREIRPTILYTRFPLQRDIPILNIAYHVKPLQGYGVGLNTLTFNNPNLYPQKEANGYYKIEISNMPALKAEPQMPPQDSVRAFVLVFYSSNDQSDVAKYWSKIGKERYEDAKPQIKPNDDVRKKTAEVVAGATTPEQVIGKLFQFIRTNIKNVNDDASDFTPQQREKFKENKQPSDTLKRGMGTGSDIIYLFASMATAAGLDARIVWAGDRSDFFFHPGLADDYFLGNQDVAIKIGNEWKFFDPTAVYLPPGMLYWGEEDNHALIPDPKESIFVITPLSSADKSLEKRKAILKLAEDGTLEGDVVIEYTGHIGAEKKEYNDDDSPAQREETLKQMLKTRMSTAELTNIQIDNVRDYDKPFTYRFHIRVPGYAQRTGKRLFLQPAFFEKGIEPLFTMSQRKYRIYFPYPWSEKDEVEIQLPEGYELENPARPQPIDVGAASKYELRITITGDHRVLQCARDFFFGSKDNLLFEPDTYNAMKTYFEAIHEADNHTLTLKQADSH